MIIRLLEPHEYHRLVEAGLPQDRLPAPEASRIIIAEEDGIVKGYFVSQLVFSAEPVWVSPDVRNSTVPARMFMKLEETMKSIGVQNYITHSSSPEIDDYLKRLGFQSTDWKMFYKSIGE